MLTVSSTTNIARMYADALKSKPKEYWDYEQFILNYGTSENYQIVCKLGRGRYSDVFQAIDLKKSLPCALKVLKSVKMSKVQREIKILQNLRGAPNIIKFMDVVKGRNVAIVTEFVANVSHKTLYPKLDPNEIQYYLFQLLLAIDYAHSNGVMHRDIKPQNVMIDPSRQILRLVDWGLGEFYHSHRAYNVRVASRYFKAPELLLCYTKYDYSIDMWSFGCMLAALVFRKEPFFQGSDHDDQLVKIVNVLGASDLKDFIKKYRINVEFKLLKLVEHQKKVPFEAFVSAGKKGVDFDSAVDLVSRLLTYDHAERLTAREALSHKYFASIKAPTTGKIGEQTAWLV